MIDADLTSMSPSRFRGVDGVLASTKRMQNAMHLSS